MSLASIRQAAASLMSHSARLHIAIVGHTNTGKTSLMRTLTRDRVFGEVADAPGTTRQVQSALCWLDGQPVLAWYDTPGLEDSIALRDWIESLPDEGSRLEGSDRVERFLRDEQAAHRFEQEHRVLQQVMHSDAVLYVIDVREPVLPKYRDELYLLNACARPVLPLLNFTASPGAEPQPWVQALARLGLHMHLQFDSVTPPIDGEALVFQMLGQLLSAHRALLKQLSEQAYNARLQRRGQALGQIAELLIDTAALEDFSAPDEASIQRVVAKQQREVRQAEQQCVDTILLMFQFGRDEYLAADLAWSDGGWHSDPFSAQAMREAGVHLGKGVAAGALAGAAVDVMSAGLTLGTGTLIGAAAGAAWQGLERWGTDLLARVKGARSVRVSDEVVLVLAVRQLQLLDALEHRGHAAQGPVRAREQWQPAALSPDQLLKLLSSARRHNDWSSMRGSGQDTEARSRVADEIRRLLDDAMQHKVT